VSWGQAQQLQQQQLPQLPQHQLGFAGEAAHFASAQHYQIPDRDRRDAYSLQAWQDANMMAMQPHAIPMAGPQGTVSPGMPPPLSQREFGQQPDPFASIVMSSIAEMTFGKSSSSPPTLE